MIRDKRVLLICKESYSFPLFFIAKELLGMSNKVGAFFIYPLESYYNKSLYNENTFYNFKEHLKEVNIYGLTDLCKKFNENWNNSIVDMDYLNNLEIEYTHFKNLNLQLMSSQLTTRHFHTRFYFSYSTFKQNLLLLELGYKRVEEVLDGFKPDLILDIDDSELLRTILNEVAFKKRIPYITIDYPRYEGYKIPTYSLGVRIENYLIEEYTRFFQSTAKDLAEEYAYILDMRKKSNIMSKEFMGTITSQYKPNSLFYTFKFLIGKIFYFWNVYIINGNIRLIKKKNILYSTPIEHFLFYVKVEIKKQYLFRKNKYFEIPDKNENYVYMPLHLIPESTTFVKTPFYINELNIIEQVSKSLPIGWKLYVKEHQSMLGERSLKFYKDVKKFPNVKLVQLNYYNDPKPWIENAKGVLTISGTGAYEAAILGKRSIVFGDVPFNLIESVSRVHSFEELPSLIASLGNIDNIKSCAAYIAAIKSVGTILNLKYLMDEGEAVINGDHELSDEFQKQIHNLMVFFEKAYEQYQIRICEPKKH